MSQQKPFACTYTSVCVSNKYIRCVYKYSENLAPSYSNSVCVCVCVYPAPIIMHYRHTQYTLTSPLIPSAGGRVALSEIPPVGLRGHIICSSGWFTGIGMEGTRPFPEQPESLRLGWVWLGAEPLRLEEESLSWRLWWAGFA